MELRSRWLQCILAATVLAGIPWQAAATIDHFKCYKVRGSGFAGLTVILTDQFGSTQTSVIKPAHLCNPVDKNGEGIFDPETHLTCYKIQDDPRFQRREVVVTNQFGEQTLLVTAPSLLCVPSDKTVVP